MTTLFIAPPKEGDFLAAGELIYLEGQEAIASYASSEPGSALMAEAKNDGRAHQYRFAVEDDEGGRREFQGKVFSRTRNPVTGLFESKILSDDPILE